LDKDWEDRETLAPGTYVWNPSAMPKPTPSQNLSRLSEVVPPMTPAFTRTEATALLPPFPHPEASQERVQATDSEAEAETETQSEPPEDSDDYDVGPKPNGLGPAE
jgi:hypothetical protein